MKILTTDTVRKITNIRSITQDTSNNVTIEFVRPVLGCSKAVKHITTRIQSVYDVEQSVYSVLNAIGYLGQSNYIK